jgi:hypothetical protein
LLEGDAEVAMACRLRSETGVSTPSVDVATASSPSLRRAVVIVPAQAMFLAFALAALGGTALVMGLRRSRLWWLPLAPHAGFLLAHAAHGVALAKYSGTVKALRSGFATKRPGTSPLRARRRKQAGKSAQPQPASAA